MSTLHKCFNAITSENIHVSNSASSDELSLCINLIQLPYPDEENTLVTLTAMKDGNKLNCIPPVAFARVLGCIEDSLKTLDDYFPYGMSLVRSITDAWYRQLRCHRVFIIRSLDIFKVLSEISKKDNIEYIRNQGIQGVRVIITSHSHQMKIDI